MLAATGVWNFVLLNRTPDWLPWLRWTVLVGAILVAAVLIVGGHQLGRCDRGAGDGRAAVRSGRARRPTPWRRWPVPRRRHPDLGPVPLRWPRLRRTRRLRAGPGPGQNQSTEQLQAMLKATDNRWAAATVGSHQAGGLELSTGTSIMVDRRIQRR